MTGIIIVLAGIAAVIGFGIWQNRQGRQIAAGEAARAEAEKRRKDDAIDAKPLDSAAASDVARRLAAKWLRD
jgi:FtsZ-interacting cell division protein ZipA